MNGRSTIRGRSIRSIFNRTYGGVTRVEFIKTYGENHSTKKALKISKLGKVEGRGGYVSKMNLKREKVTRVESDGT